ncbi:MAG: TusE/DsrC/DsvC family sulfur relay protein [Thiogranum sp.]|nr:TusE/DsrC/DsvC family sulfur relay protein [Thiogranum sp.]
MSSACAARAPEHSTLDQLERDEEGFLLDAQDWHPGLIDAFAAEDGLELTPERREIIDYIRSYFESNFSVPEARVLLRHMETIWGKDRATRRYLYKLFPRGYGQQACKIAGMRKPRKLMLDV